MSRYRRRDPYRNKALGNYRIESPKYYRTKKAYFRPYYKILFKRNYKLPLMRKARGRIEGYYKPRQENFRTFEEKYELKPKPEKISAPPILKPLRYTSQSMVETQIDTERIAKEVEGRVKKEITGELLERFESELEELMRKFNDATEKFAKTVEEKEKLETDRELRTNAELIDERTEREVDNAENDEGSHVEQEKNLILEGGFNIYPSLGLAIPVEDREEFEAEKSPEEYETNDLENVENMREIRGPIELKTANEPLETDIEKFEAEMPVEAENQVIKEEIVETQDKLTPELLPEESELFPIEKTEIHD